MNSVGIAIGGALPALVGSVMAITAITSGKVAVKTKVLRRRKEPGAFWLVVVVYLGMAAFGFAVLAKLMYSGSG